MEPDKSRDRKSHAPREEHEVASRARKSVRSLQGKVLHEVETSGSSYWSAHGEDSTFDSHSSPPQHDRAG